MKNIFLAFFLFISFSSFGQDTTEVVSNASIYKDVKSALSQLSEALQVGSEHTYKVLVKQQKVNSITHSFVYFLFIISICFSVMAMRKEDSNDYSSENIYRPTTIILTVFFVLYFMFSIEYLISGFINPEYGAIKDILKVIK